MIVEEELNKFFASMGTGMKREYVEDENGFNRMILTVQEAIAGDPSLRGRIKVPGGSDISPTESPLRSEMQQAEPRDMTAGEIATEMGTATAGAATGIAAGAVGLPGDFAALLYGAYKALFPNQDETRGQAFVNAVETVSNAAGAEAALNLINSVIPVESMTPELRDAFEQSQTAGTFVGLGKAGKAATAGVKEFIKEAPARVAARQDDTGVTLGAGVDPTPMIDEAIVAVKSAKEKYLSSPNDKSARQEYLDARHKRDALLSSMPSDKKMEVDTSYRMAHQPTSPKNGAARLDDMTGGGTVFPDDIYSGDAVRLYGGSNPADEESAKIIQSVKGDPEAEVTIYRAVPNDVDTINPGDWVTLSKRYAEDHAESGYGAMGDEAGKVVSQKVKVKDVYSDGNDLNEFGYFPKDIVDLNAAKLEPPKENKPGIIAFHGSNADFDEFRLEKIGTGMRQTQYGHGLYFSEKEDVAKFFKNLQGESGKIYKTELYISEGNMLDWQTPLKDQPSEIQEKVRSTVPDYLLDSFDKNVESGISGGNAYTNYVDGKTPQDISKTLENAGIDGIKYLEIGSSLGYTLKDAPTNYVVFNDKATKILEKYGIVGPVSIAAMNAGGSDESEAM